MTIGVVNKQRFALPYMWLIVSLGALACAFSATRLSVERLDPGFLLLTMITLGLGSRLSIQIPRLSSHISVSDTLIFLTMMLYGGDVAVLLAAAEALC